MNKLAIYINSFDGYSDIWPYFFSIFDKYWSDCEFSMYLSSNELEYDYKNLRTIKVGKEVNWLHRTIESVSQIKEEYLLFMLEDYFISKQINNDNFLEIIEHMKNFDILYYQLSSTDGIDKNKKYVKIKGNREYPISLQLAIWKKDKFLEVLKEIQSTTEFGSPWDFERFFYKKYINTPNDYIDGVEYDTRDLMGYKNGVLQGKWIRKTIHFYEKQGFEFKLSHREMMSIKDSLIYDIKRLLSIYMGPELKKILKRILTKFGVKFMME